MNKEELVIMALKQRVGDLEGIVADVRAEYTLLAEEYQKLLDQQEPDFGPIDGVIENSS